MAGEIRDELSFNQFIEKFSYNTNKDKRLRVTFEEYLTALLGDTLEAELETNTQFPVITALLTRLEGNYLKDIHMGKSSKNLGSMINKWLEYSISDRKADKD